MAKLLKQNQTTRVLTFLITDSTDHISPKTGLTPTVTISKNGAAFGSPAGAVSEIGNGWYQIAGNATDANTIGPLIVHATATGADPTDTQYQVVAFDPSDGVALGLTALPNAAAAASGGLPTVGTGAGQVNPDGTGAVPLAFGTALPSNPTANTVGEALFLADLLGGRVNTAQGGTSTTITLDASASASAGAYIGDDIYLYGGTGGGIRGSGQRRSVTAYNPSTKVATLHRAWDITPDATTKFITMPVAKADVYNWVGGTPNALSSGRIDASVGAYPGNTAQTGDNYARLGAPAGASIAADIATRSTFAGGAVASVAGAVGSVTGAVGSVTGNVGGNVTGSVGSVVAAVTAGTVSDKTGYALTTGEHTAVATDAQTGLTAQGYTTARAPYLDELSAANVPADVDTLLTRADVATSTRLATGGYTAPDNADIVLIKAKTDNLPADPASNTQVNTRMPSGNVTVGGYASGQDPTTLVLGHSDSSYSTPGIIGYDIKAGGSSADPLTNLVPGTYPAGSAGAVLGAIVTDTITIIDPGTLTGTLRLIIGQSYGATHGALAVSDTLPSTASNLSGATVSLEIGVHTGTPLITAVTAVSGPTSAQVLTTPLTSTQTALLFEPPPALTFAYWADWGGSPADRLCVRHGPVIVQAAP